MPTHDVLSCYQLFGFNISDIYKYRAAEFDRFISVIFLVFVGLVSSDFSTVFHEECVVLPGVCALTSPTSLGITIAFPLFFMYTDVSPSFTMAYCNVYSLRCVKIMIIKKYLHYIYFTKRGILSTHSNNETLDMYIVFKLFLFH